MSLREEFSSYTASLTAIGSFCAIGTGVAIPLSTSITSVFTILVILAWILSGKFVKFPQLVVDNRIIFSVVMLSIVFFLGCFYTSGSSSEIINILKKYRKLLFIAIFIPFLSKKRVRQLACYSFLTGLLLLMLTSYCMKFNFLIPIKKFPTTLISPITHNIFMAFGSFWIAHKIFSDNRFRLLWVTFLVLSAINIFFIVQGRTGYVVFIFLAVLFLFQKFETRKFSTGFIVLALFLISLAYIPGPFSRRIDETLLNYHKYSESHETRSSVGQRLDFLITSLKLVTEKPVFGYGTGSFAKEYAEISKRTGAYPTDNPHNEYLMIGVQLGLVGVAFYLYLLFVQWKYSYKLENEFKWLAQGLVVTMVIGSFFNSMLLDAGEGHFFAYLSAVLFAPLSHTTQQLEQTASQEPESLL